jgi:hypothetical protein
VIVIGAGAVTTGSAGAGGGGSDDASCSRPHRGQVQVVVPGFAWNRDPQERQITNPHSLPHDEQVYPLDPASTCWAVSQFGHRTDGMSRL